MSAEPQSCVICLDEVTEAVVIIPCQHSTFHHECLTKWLELRPTCPLCTQAVLRVKCEDVRRSLTLHENIRDILIPRDPHAGVRSDRLQPSQTSPRTQEQEYQRGERPWGQHLRGRKAIYEYGLYSLHNGTNRYSRHRNLTPTLFKQSKRDVLRARIWIRRELEVFEFLNVAGRRDAIAGRGVSSREYLLEYIIAILRTINLQGSDGQAVDIVSDFLGRKNARLFLHELRAFLRSPFLTLREWDGHVQYQDTIRSSRHTRPL